MRLTKINIFQLKEFYLRIKLNKRITILYRKNYIMIIIYCFFLIFRMKMLSYEPLFSDSALNFEYFEKKNIEK